MSKGARLLAALSLMLLVWFVATPEGQNRGWVLVNGALSYFGPVSITGTTTVTGALSATGAVSSTTSGISAAASGKIGFNSQTKLGSTADKLLQILDSGSTTGTEVNGGSATLGTCTGGTIVTGSHNTVGGYTGNTSGSCVINFGTPSFTNAPFCFAMSTASTTHPRVSASATGSITITGGVSGEAINYVCLGRIGT